MFKEKKNIKKPFFNPSQPIDTSSESPTDVANKKIKNDLKKNASLINFTEGKHDKIEFFNNLNHNGYGRTLNVPKELPAGVIPGPSYNGAVTIGKACKGNHCSIAVNPTTFDMVRLNAKNSLVKNNKSYMYPSTYRLGNNSDIIQGIKKYKNKGINHGPFNIDVQSESLDSNYTINPKTNRKVKIMKNI